MPQQDPLPSWAVGPLVADDAATPLRVIEFAKGSSGASGQLVADNPSMIGSIEQAKAYLTDDEKAELGLD